MASVKLDPERYQQLLDAERQLMDILSDYDKAEQCGIDCTEIKALNAEARRRIAKTKEHFGPEQTYTQ